METGKQHAKLSKSEKGSRVVSYGGAHFSKRPSVSWSNVIKYGMVLNFLS